MTTELLLAGDIGGTKTNLALYPLEGDPLHPLALATFLNRDAAGIEDHITAFLDAHGQDGRRVRRGCFGVAGPVRDNRVRLTKLAWSVDGAALAGRFGWQRVSLINDLVAMAEGAVRQPGDRLHPVNGGRSRPGAMAVLAPGTGLGEALLVEDGQGTLLPVASEGGHGGFAPRDQLQVDLLRFALARRNPVSVDSLCSGPGLADLFDFLATRLPVPPQLARELKTAVDRTPVIARTALAAPDDPEGICQRTVRLFFDILAGEAANLALRVLAVGGLYIGGGLVPRLLAMLDRKRFMAVFARGVYADMLARVPVHVLLDPLTPLHGAAAHGMELAVRRPATV